MRNAIIATLLILIPVNGVDSAARKGGTIEILVHNMNWIMPIKNCEYIAYGKFQSVMSTECSSFTFGSLGNEVIAKSNTTVSDPFDYCYYVAIYPILLKG